MRILYIPCEINQNMEAFPLWILDSFEIFNHIFHHVSIDKIPNITSRFQKLWKFIWPFKYYTSTPFQAFFSAPTTGHWQTIFSGEKIFLRANRCTIFWIIVWHVTYYMYSWVINLDSVTILWLVRFDAWFDFFGPFVRNLASMSLPKILAIFSRGQNPKMTANPILKKFSFEPGHQ